MHLCCTFEAVFDSPHPCCVCTHCLATRTLIDLLHIMSNQPVEMLTPPDSPVDGHSDPLMMDSMAVNHRQAMLSNCMLELDLGTQPVSHLCPFCATLLVPCVVSALPPSRHWRLPCLCFRQHSLALTFGSVLALLGLVLYESCPQQDSPYFAGLGVLSGKLLASLTTVMCAGLRQRTQRSSKTWLAQMPMNSESTMRQYACLPCYASPILLP